MVRRSLRNLVSVAARVGADPNDTDEVRLQKTLLVSVAMLPSLAGIVWGSLYLAYDEPLAAVIPYAYTALSAISIAILAVTRRFTLFRFSQLLLILLLPFFLLVALGGFVNSGAVIFWGLLSPLGATLFDEPRRATRWFLAYLALVVAGGFLQPYGRPSNNLPEGVVLAYFVMNIGGVSAVAFFLLSYFVGQKNQIMNLLRLEQEKAESLLLNILPKEIAAILKNENRIIADHYDGASVLFADLVDFTPLTNELEPVEMVALLNEIFSYFDSLVEKYDLEKIRTIGDNYFVAAGVPRPRPDHAHALGRMALDMRTYIASRPPSRTGRRLDFRIGINSGPVVAGVIGRKKFVYDVWGDAVNLGSRMESSGVAGRIQIGRATYELIKDNFICEPRGKVNIKGKGEVETWYLLGVREGELQVA